MRGRPRVWLAAAALGLAAPGADAEGPLFEMWELPSPGRSVAAEIADLDGDGRADLLEVAYLGLPPDERRRIRVRFQGADGRFAREPDLDVVLPAESAAYDLADVIGGPGHELLLLGARGVAILTFRDGVQTRRLELPEGRSIGAGPDERGLDRVRLVTRAFGDEPWLVVPGLGEAFLLAPGGELRARLEVGGRANFFIDPPGLLVSDSDIQLFFDAPRLAFGDVDGDGRADVVASGRHELRVFLRRPDGSFGSRADRRLWLRRVNAEDHVRSSGTVRSLLRDIDSDGRLDLVIAQIEGGILDSRDRVSVHLNRDGGWNLDAPDAAFASDHAASGVTLLDLDADGRLELLRVLIPLNVLELIEVLVTRALDARILVYGMDAGGGFSQTPRFERKRDVPLDFSTGRARGFFPVFDADWNGDGLPDLVTSGDGTRLEIQLGTRQGGYAETGAGQAMETEGRLRSGDLDGDGLRDLVLYNPRRPDAPLRLGRNRGALPGAARSPPTPPDG